MKEPDAKELLYDLIAALPKCECGEPAQYNDPLGPRCWHHRTEGSEPLAWSAPLQASIHAFSFFELKRLGFVLRAP